MICVRGAWNIRENNNGDWQAAHVSVCSPAPQSVCKCTILCISDSAHSSLFSSTRAISSPSPASVSKSDLRIGPGPRGSCRDWISNQCYTSCVPASAIFNTQGETLPGEKGKYSACVGSSTGGIIKRTLGRRLNLKMNVRASILKILEAHKVG